DMAGSLIRNDPGGKEMIRFWREIREMIDRDYPDTFLVSEWSSPLPALRGGFHADFLHWFKEYNSLFRNEGWKTSDPTGNHSFFHKNGKGDITAFLDVYLPLLQRTRRHGYISIPLGNHDLPRINMGRSTRDLEIITAFILTIPGVPFLYYGDEIGMRQLEGDHLPTREGCYPPRNGARTPMQWTAGRNAGFSSAPAAKLYLPVDHAKTAPNVAAQEKSSRSLLNRTRALVKLRRTEPALAAHADFVPLYAKKNRYPLVFLRKNGRRRVVVALNPGAEPARTRIRLPQQAASFELLAGNGAELQGRGSSATCVMDGRSYGIWAVK
ncbi:MAG: alpha-amylase, partial [Chitinivibrionales bacterium]|nr:alpha-amylase [Chitinivibrionales bacterium]